MEQKLEFKAKPHRMPGRLRRMALAILSLAVAFAGLPVSAAAAQGDAAPAGDAWPERTLDREQARAFLDEFFASDFVKALYTGAAVAIVKDGEIIANEGYGYADKERGMAVDPDATVFRLASVSKTFTAVAVMQLAEQGKIDLSGDIRQYLPEDLAFENPFGKPVTVADLLTHRSGFAPSEPLVTDMVTDLSVYVSLEDYARERMPAVVREPGSAYMYDNYAYLLLGLIVQHVSGQPFEDYMRDHVFEPLGMTMSGFELKGALLENVAVAYDAAGNPLETYFYLPNVMPHGGMLSTAGDVARFMIAFLNGGKAPGGRVLSASSVEMMREYRSAIHPLLPDTTYGFEAPMQLPQTASSSRVIAKYGDLPGNSSMLLFIPDENVGVFLTYNTAGGLRNLFYHQFMGTFFPDYLVPLEPAADPAETPAADGESLARYAGYYSDLRLSGIVYRVGVTEQDGRAALTFHDAYLGTRELVPVAEHLFLDPLSQTLTAFGVDADGRVAFMREGSLNPLGYAAKAPEPAGFADVPETDPYAPYIHTLQSLGLYPNEAGLSFEPERPVTRAELARDLLVISGIRQAVPRDAYAFSDIAGHELAPFVQMAADMGMVMGDGQGLFHPDRPAERQEAAVMVWNVYRQLYPPEIFDRVRITGDFDPWAKEAIRMAVVFGLHGPEVVSDAGGAADFRGRAPMTRREAAAFYHQLLFQPVTQMVAQLLQLPQEQPASGLEAGEETAAEPAADRAEDRATDAADPPRQADPQTPASVRHPEAA